MRYDFGGSVPDWAMRTVTVGVVPDLAQVVRSGTATFWTAKTGGTQHVDLTLAGAAVASVPVGANGVLPDLKGPDGVTAMFVSVDGGERLRIVTWTNAGAAGGSGGAVVDASSTTRGVVQLAGDLGGTAAAPTVPGLAGKAAATHQHPVADLSDVTLDAIETFLKATSPGDARAAVGAGVATVMTQAEATAGTDTAPRQMTAQVLKNAITSLGGSSSGSVGYPQLPPGSTLTYDYARGGFGAAAGALPTARPTARTDITIVWTVPFGTDVAAVAIATDKVDFY